MASGKLGTAALAAAVTTDLYTVPMAAVATVNLNLCNRTAAAIAVRVAVRSGALAEDHYIEYDAKVPANGVLERTGIVMSAGEVLTVRAAAAGISVRAHGFEEAA